MAALIIVGRAAFAIAPLPAGFTRWGTGSSSVPSPWALMNFASPSGGSGWYGVPSHWSTQGLCFVMARLHRPDRISSTLATPATCPDGTNSHGWYFSLRYVNVVLRAKGRTDGFGR